MKSNDVSYLNFLVFISIFLLTVSIPTHLFGLQKIAIVILPLPLFFTNNDPVKVFIYFLICYLAFFEAFLPTSKVGGFIHVQDSILIFFLLLLFLKKRKPLVFSFPFSHYLLLLYCFIGHTVIMTVPSIIKMGFDIYVIDDLKSYLYLLTICIFLQTDLFSIKNIVRLFIIITVFSSFWGLACIFHYLKTWERIITWNESYFGLSVTIGVILIRLIKNTKTKYLLIGASVINFIALLLTQTRGMWLATFISIVFYLLLDLRKSGLSNLLKKMLIISSTFFVLVAGLLLFNNFNLITLINSRFSQKSENEFLDPTASMGYRVYESYTVFKERTWFGHGSGARIYLYTPFFKKWTNFWAIHSEYFEILHKYGIIGLLLLMTILFSTFHRLLRICFSKKMMVSTIGEICFCSLISLVFVSITSGYLSRVNIMFFLILIFGIANNYGNRKIPQIKVQNKEIGSVL